MTSSITIPVPARVRYIMQFLLDAGHTAYIVGGCVRDGVMNRPVIDHDITTSATPAQLKKIYSTFKLIDIGERHGTIGVYDNGQTYEITTYRTEGGYSDGRRPDSVTFVNDLQLDLARRDFTINAMAANIEGQLFDPYGGIKDIEIGVIRAVGDPNHRLTEDSLRILRAFRFALRFSFNLDESTASAIKEVNHLLIEHAITGERIGIEFDEILRYGDKGVASMYELGTLQTLFPFLSLDIDFILPRYLSLPTTSVDVNLALLVEPTYTKLETKKEKRTLLRDIFSIVKGWGLFRQTRIQALLEHGTIPDLIFETEGNAELLRWIDRVFSFYQSKNEFLYTTERDELIAYASGMSGKDISFLQSRIDAVAKQLAQPLPVNGHDAKKLGYEGPEIRDILYLWTYAAHYLAYTEVDQFITLITNSQEERLFDPNLIRLSISNDSPKNTKEEDDYVHSILQAYQTIYMKRTEKNFL